MAFNKRDWANGERITEGLLDDLEQRIEQGLAEVPVEVTDPLVSTLVDDDFSTTTSSIKARVEGWVADGTIPTAEPAALTVTETSPGAYSLESGATSATIYGLTADQKLPSAAKTDLDNRFVPRTELDAELEALGEGRVVPEPDLSGWFLNRIANAASGEVIDLMGRDITLTQTANLWKPVTLRNGTLRRDGSRVALVNATGIVFENMRFVRTGTDDGDGGAGVYVQKTGFVSRDCHYSSTVSSGLVLQHGTCNGARIFGGSATSFKRAQNASGIYVGGGNVGNYDIVIDGVTVVGGPDRGPDGILLYDAANSVVRRCQVKNLRKLPDVTIPAWTFTGTANTWVSSAPVRSDGPTRALIVDGGEWTENGFAADKTKPAANTWTTVNDLVYINTTTDPNTRTIVSRIVSGYGITLYCTSGSWRTMSNNVVAHNRVEDTDGFGVYLQVGDVVATGNSTDSNVLVNTCLAGEQSNKLPFAAIGVVGGKQTTLSNDTIDGAVSNGVKVSSDYDDPSNYSTGSITGLRVRNITGQGVLVGGGNWQIVNTNVTLCTLNGFQLYPEQATGTVGVSLINCESSYNTLHGINATASASANLTVNVVGGFYRKNTQRGMNAHQVDTLTVGGGALFDGNPGYNLNVTDQCVNVHLDGVVFQNANGLSVGNGVAKLTTGRLIWGPNVSTKVAGTGAHRVQDVFEVPIVTAPDGTQFKLSVANDGSLTTTSI